MDGSGVRRKRISYVTDLDNTMSGGGSYAVNWHAFDELSKRFDAFYAGPIVPRAPLVGRNVSRIRRRIPGMRGKYSYFSPHTLDRNAELVEKSTRRDDDAVVFRSSGRWCRSRPSVPYFVYLDAVVHTFFHNTFNPRHFDLADLDRIWNEEGKFLERASGVFFESEWGMNMAKAAYSLVKDHYYVAGRGGVVSPPEADTWNGGDLRLVTIAMNFRQKGGDLVAAAFRLLEPRYPRLSWSIVGGPPDFDVGATSRITYEGFLRPDRPSEYARFREILSSAFLCVHPAREDVVPLVLTEAAYFGCPSVSVKVFGIPELVLDGRTGILLDPPPEPAAIAAAIESLLLDAKRYDEMRRHARDYALARFQWPHVGAIICDGIERALEK